MGTTCILDVATPLTMVLAETTSQDSIYYLHGLDLVAQSDGTTIDYLAYDGLGSVRQVLDDVSVPLLNQTFDPYGNLLARGGTGESRFGFTGEQVDANGLVYLRARYYQPGMGRFLNMDPSRQEMNPYQYGFSNPIDYTDPSGLIPIECMIDSDSDECLDARFRPYIVSREQWGAREPVFEYCYEDFYGEECIRGEDVFWEGLYDADCNPDGYAPYEDYKPGQTLEEIIFGAVIHHSGNTNDMTIQEVQNEHMDGNEHMADIGYHFVIAKDGTIYEGRDIGVRGFHVTAANTGRVGILVVGDFEPGDWLGTYPNDMKISNEDPDIPTSNQIDSLTALIRYLDVIYGLRLVEGHNDVNPDTRCPGNRLEPYVVQLDSQFGGE